MVSTRDLSSACERFAPVSAGYIATIDEQRIFKKMYEKEIKR
jgi:hypothetical protein